MVAKIKHPGVPCARCGVPRQANRKGSLCRDCIGSITAKERKEWLSPKKK